MIEYTLNIGEVVVSSGNISYTCFGLSSCIGLFIQDRVTGQSGGAHIFLPDSEQGPSDSLRFYNVSSAVEEIMYQLKLNGNALTSLRAKVTGGANVIGMKTKTGERNVQSILKHLTERKIFIAAADVGGTYSRTARFESKTGLLTVKKIETNEIKVF